MSENILYRDETSAAIIKLAENADDKIKWNDFVVEMKEFIISNYDGKPLAVYKGDWKRRFRQAVKTLNRVWERSVDEENWPLVIDNALKSKKSSGTTTTSSNSIVTEERKKAVIEKYSKIKESEKWTLSTGNVVDDVMKARVEEAVYEHPVHSFIFDLSDPLWKKYFTDAELKEASCFNNIKTNAIPSELQEYMSQYESFKSVTDYRKFIFSHYIDPATDFNKKWIQESFLNASNLFNYCTSLRTGTYSEAELLHKVWSFVYTLFDDNDIEARLGEKCSVVVALIKNANRSLELVDKRNRKMMGAKLDILFKRGLIEVGSCEIGKDDVVDVDDKYLDDGRVKLPKTLRDMLSMLVNKNPTKINQLKTVGFLMMGLSMELLIMDVPVGCTITRIRKSSKFDFPCSIDDLSLDLIPLLELSWKGKQIMKDTLATLGDRKRKSTEAAFNNEDDPISLPPSFYDC